MKWAVYFRDDFTRPAEKGEAPAAGTLGEFLRRECPRFSENPAAVLSFWADGRRAGLGDSLAGVDLLAVVADPAGLDGVSLAAMIAAAVMAVGTAAYSMIMLNKLSAQTGQTTQQGASIYDVNAQGNKARLGSVIPENFGKFKRFPDYLADPHSWYDNSGPQSRRVMDLLLCQGAGEFDRAGDLSDVYVGETPVNQLPDCSVTVVDPGVIFAAAGVPSGLDGCWYSSLQVNQAGIDLKPAENSVGGGTKRVTEARFAYDSFRGSLTETGYYTGANGQTQQWQKVTPLRLDWPPNSHFSISGVGPFRLLGTGTAEPESLDEDGRALVRVPLAWAGDLVPQWKELLWVRGEETDAETGEITRAGDPVLVSLEKILTARWESEHWATGNDRHEATASEERSADARIVRVETGGSAALVVEVASGDLSVPPDPPFTFPGGAYNTRKEIAFSVRVLQPPPEDYPWRAEDGTADNGLYILGDYDAETGKTSVLRLGDLSMPDEAWPGFWASGLNQPDARFTLEDADGDAGGRAGPYRATPVGCTSAHVFELDFLFPQGVGYLRDDGGFDDLTVVLKVEYMTIDPATGEISAWRDVFPADGNPAPGAVWDNDEKLGWVLKVTRASNDEFGLTAKVNYPGAHAYYFDFAVRNLTESDGSTRRLEAVKWVGLKSLITHKNKYEGVTVLAGRFVGSSVLAGLSENQISTLWTRKLAPAGSPDAAPVPTRDLAPVVQYVAGCSRFADFLDLDNIREYDARWRARGLTLDGAVDDDNTLFQVLADALKTGYSSLDIRDNKLYITRLGTIDETGIAQFFTPGNLTGPARISYSLPGDDDAQEIEVDYTSGETFKTETVFVTLDEAGAKTASPYMQRDNQEKLTAWGVTSPDQAERLAARRMRYLRNVRVSYEITTEYDGLNCRVNDVVLLALDADLSTIAGRVLSFDGTTGDLTVDREIPAELSAGVVYLRNADGRPVEARYSRQSSRVIRIPPGSWKWPEADAGADFPLFAVGEIVKAWVAEVTPGDHTCDLRLINYAPEIFTDDPPLVPETETAGYGRAGYGITPYGGKE